MKLFSYSTQLSTKFQLLIKTKIPTKKEVSCFKSLRCCIPDKKKKRTTTIFPIKVSFLYENVNCHEILISDQILLKLKCDLDEYLYFPCVGTKHIKASGKRVLER